MPNWVKTIVKTKPDVLNDIMKRYSEKGIFSFAKLIPMPKDLDIECGSRGEEGLMYLFIESTDDEYKMKINKAFHDLNIFHNDIYKDKRFEEIEDNYKKYKNDSDFKESIELGKQYLENYEKYGHCNWYEWRCNNWGTKWDINQCSYKGDTLIFKTAWDFSYKIIEKLSKLYPTAVFDCKFADEGIAENSGIVEYKNGEIIFSQYNLSEKKINDIWDTYISEEKKTKQLENEIEK